MISYLQISYDPLARDHIVLQHPFFILPFESVTFLSGGEIIQIISEWNEKQ